MKTQLNCEFCRTQVIQNKKDAVEFLVSPFSSNLQSPRFYVYVCRKCYERKKIKEIDSHAGAKETLEDIFGVL